MDLKDLCSKSILLLLLIVFSNVTVSNINALGYFGSDGSDSDEGMSYRMRNDRRREMVSDIRRRDSEYSRHHFPMVINSRYGKFVVTDPSGIEELERMIEHEDYAIQREHLTQRESSTPVEDVPEDDDISLARESLSRQMEEENTQKQYYREKTDLIQKQNLALSRNINSPKETAAQRVKRSTTDKFIDTASTIAVASTVAILSKVLDPLAKFFKKEPASN